MLFEESDLLKALPEQFFAGLVAKVNAKVAAVSYTHLTLPTTERV